MKSGVGALIAFGYLIDNVCILEVGPKIL